MNRRNWKKIVLVSIVLLAVLISGFSALTSNASAKPLNTRAQGGVLKIAMQQDMPNFNPFDLASNTVWKSDVIGWNFESLMGMDYDGSAYPVLAQKVDFDEKTMTATIYLRHNVTFQDGTPMTAKDVIFSYFALRQGTTISGTTFTVPFDDNNDGTVSYSELANHIKYVNDYEIKISARQPYNYFFLGTLGVPIIPEHIWKNHLVDVDGHGTSVDAHGYTHGVIDVSWNSDPAATIGTGPWMYGGGVRDSYRIEVPYDGYWGKNFKSPDGYPFWNPNVTELYFKIYTNLDTAVLALQTGDVDYIAWSLEPGKVPVLEKDPDIDLHFMPDRGYFYLAFNEKTQPANYIAFRHAVSHVIDKQTAVQRYLGGFGQAGDSPEPPFFTGWYNESVQHYSYDANIATKILNGEKVVGEHNFVEQDPAWGEKFPVGASGWRTLPDGSPMKPITLFTPPADYDPVRIKVGQGIAQNLRAIGINIQAKPVDFDTLVAYMQSYNYQMLELGWLLGSDPIGNLADIYGPKAIQNTYGWWNASDPNPYYVDSGGVHNTLADAQSQHYATLFEKVINKALTSFNTTVQIKYTKWAEDIITKAVVCNILYYRLNVEATRHSWEGWVEWQGSVYNGLSLGMLHRATGGAVHHAKRYLDMGINVPNKILVGNTVNGYVQVMSSDGMPVRGATVSFESTRGLLNVTSKTSYTDNDGMLEFSVTPKASGFDILNITASFPSYGNITKSVVIQTVNAVPNLLSMNVEADKYSLNPGDSVNVKVTVVDQNGAPVKGALVSVNTEIVGYGTITPSNETTDANGVATFKYTAPSASEMASGKYVNMHTIAKLMFSAEKEGYNLANTVTMQLVTYNKNPSQWSIVRVEKVTNYTVNSTSLKTDIHVHAYGVDGSALANKEITISYSNASYLSNPPASVKTDAKGWANFTLTFNNGLPTKVVRIGFGTTDTYNVGDSIDILYWNGNVGVPLYGGHVVLQPFMNQGGHITYQIFLYNQTNQHPAGTQNVSIIITSTPDGQLADSDDFSTMNTADEYVGINVYGDYSDSVFGTAGVWYGAADKTKPTVNWQDWGVSLADYGYPASWDKETTWDYLYMFYGLDMEPIQIKNGVSPTFGIDGVSSSYRDLSSTLYVVTNSVTYYITDPSVNNFVMYGNQTFQSEFAIQRAMHLVVNSYQLSSPYVWAGDSFNVVSTAYNESNVPIPYQRVVAYNNAISSHAIYPSATSYTTPTVPDEYRMQLNSSNSDDGNLVSNIVLDGPIAPGTLSITWQSNGVTYVAHDSPRGSYGLIYAYAWDTANDPFGLFTFHFLGFGIVFYNIGGGQAMIWFFAMGGTAPLVGVPVTAPADLYSDFVVNYQVFSNSAEDKIASDSTSTSYNYTLSETPVLNNTVSVTWSYMGNSYTATDDGNGKITGPYLNGTIDYTTGKISLKFDKAPDLGYIYIDYQFNPAQSAAITVNAPMMSSASEVNVFVEASDMGGKPSASPGFGEYHILESTQIAVVPHQLFISATPSTYVVDLGGTIGFSTQVTDANGKVFSGATVSASSTAGTIINAGDGEFILDTSGITAPNVLNEVQVTFTINGMDGYMVGATTITVLVRNLPPSISVNSLSDGANVYDNTLALSGYAYDDQGISSVVVTVDGSQAQAANMVIVPGGVAWNVTLTGLSEGTHTITVNATDSQGVYQVTTLTVHVKYLLGQNNLPDVTNLLNGKAGTNELIGITGIILAIIALILGAWALAKKPKEAAPAEEEVPTEEEEMPAEEEETTEETEETTEEEIPEETEETTEENPPEEGGEEL